jgi:precorrin-2 dehydrogenase/sirohydrochlorin ferrochelatase
MSFYPICLDLEGKFCVVVGGGRVAERKISGLIACGGRVSVISPELTDGLINYHNEGTIQWLDREYRPGDLKQAFLVIAATNDEETQRQIYEEAAVHNLLLNVADVPQRCNFIMPAAVRQGDLIIAVSTAGKSPALARKLRMDLEKRYGAEYKTLVHILGVIRPQILALGLSQAENEQIFTSLLHEDMAEWIRTRNWTELENHLAGILENRVGGDWLPKIRPFYL